MQSTDNDKAYREAENLLRLFAAQRGASFNTSTGISEAEKAGLTSEIIDKLVGALSPFFPSIGHTSDIDLKEHVKSTVAECRYRQWQIQLLIRNLFRTNSPEKAILLRVRCAIPESELRLFVVEKQPVQIWDLLPNSSGGKSKLSPIYSMIMPSTLANYSRDEPPINAIRFEDTLLDKKYYARTNVFSKVKPLLKDAEIQSFLKEQPAINTWLIGYRDLFATPGRFLELRLALPKDTRELEMSLQFVQRCLDLLYPESI
jgi:hypothetical protein